MSQREYKVSLYREPIISSILLAGGKVDPERFTEFLNEHAAEGWRVVTVEREERRTLLFFKREAFVIVLERDRG